MDAKEKLGSLRGEVNELDREMIALFNKRMKASEKIAKVKAEGNMALTDLRREEEMLENALSLSDAESRAETMSFMRTLIALSRIREAGNLGLPAPIEFPPSAPKKEKDVTAAFQGVPGAWGEQGAAELFPGAALQGYEYFEDVFEAVKSGAADYGVLPIENSQTGAIGEVYDLLRRHACYIVGEVWISIKQCLMAPPGATLADIREVLSHPEGLGQCRRYLKNKNWDLTSCRNTAVAAALVAEEKNKKRAAIGSRRAAEINGLSVLAPDIMDSPSNKTRFIAIAAAPLYDENSTVTSITFSTSHKSGALCAVLQSLWLSNISLTRIESRPVSPDRYRFFADLEANILSQNTRDALLQAATQCDYFEILGSYSTTAEE